VGPINLVLGGAGIAPGEVAILWGHIIVLEVLMAVNCRILYGRYAANIYTYTYYYYY